MNNRNGTFTESAFERAVALPDRGEPVAGMGADARDVDNDGRPDVFQTALAAETFPLFRNPGGDGLRGRHGPDGRRAPSPAPGPAGATASST